MTYEEGIFFVVAAAAVVGGLGVVSARNVVHCALFLILTLLSVAGAFILMSAEFLAIVQILIYGGAVTILLLFALMLTRGREVPRITRGSQWPLAAIASASFLGLSVFAIVSTKGAWQGAEAINVIQLEELGDALFRNWAVPFEIASLVLIVALVGAVILAKPEEDEE